MTRVLRYVLLLIIAIAGGIIAERTADRRDRARAQLAAEERAAGEEARRLAEERLARLEREADLVRAAAEASRAAGDATRWTTRPRATDGEDPEGAPGAGPRGAEAPPRRRVDAAKLRGAAKALQGTIAKASEGGSSSRASALTPPAGPSEAKAETPPEEQRKPGTGLRGEYWKLLDQELSDFPEIEKKLPAITRIDPQIAFLEQAAWRFPFVARNVAVRWRGFLYVEEDGVHTITLGADDGAWLDLDGRLVIDNGGLHAHRERSADVFLQQGYHAIEVRYFQNEGAASAALSWVPFRGEPGPIPADVLYPAERVRAEHAPTIDKVTPERARAGQEVVIEGTGFPRPPEPVEATFDGVDMRAEVLSNGKIRATMPMGVDRGQIVVRVRDRSSLGFAYECGDVFGLLGEYIPTPEGAPLRSLYEIPPAGHASAFRRVEPVIAFYSQPSFGLPFAPRRFGARYRGSLCVIETGEYRLKLTSDDGARLSVGGEVTAELDGLHGMVSAESTVFLARGLHDVLLEYFQNDGGAGLLLEWIRPGGKRFSLVPRRYLYPPPVVTRNEPPEIDAIEPPEVSLGETIEIVGRNFDAAAAGNRILLNGVAVEALSASPVRLVARVPEGARTGSIVVQTGELVSRPAPVKIVGRGLTGTYYKLEDPLDALPSLRSLPPAFVRRDPQIRFGEGLSFLLPFEAVRFAVEWRGFIDAPAAGTYKFALGSDDGSRLEIAGRRVVEDDGLHVARTVEGSVDLAAGRHAILIEYFQNEGFAAIDLWWTVPGRHPERVPETALFPER